MVLLPDGLEAEFLGQPRDREHPAEGVVLPVGLDLQAETHSGSLLGLV